MLRADISDCICISGEQHIALGICLPILLILLVRDDGKESWPANPGCSVSQPDSPPGIAGDKP